MKNEYMDTRPIARPKEVSDVVEYYDEKTHELKGYSLSIKTEDNCWPGIFARNPFRPPFSPYAYIKTFSMDLNGQEIGVKYVFPNIISKYVFPKLKLFERDVKQDGFKLANDFRQEMLKQIKCLKTQKECLK